MGRHFSPCQAAVSRDPPIPPGIPLVVFGIICNPYTSFILKLFSDLGDYFRATVVDWTWGLGRTALGGGAFACLKVASALTALAFENSVPRWFRSRTARMPRLENYFSSPNLLR